MTHRFLLLASFVTVLALLSQGTNVKTLRQEPDISGTSFRVTAWPKADQLFHSDPRWLGGDAAYSINLGHGRVLWLFGDSFISEKPRTRRSESEMVHNSIAIESGYNPEKASLKFYWPTNHNRPTAFVSGGHRAWLWPEDGVRLGEQLLLFFVQVRPDRSKDSLGFSLFGWAAFLVNNPEANPSAWAVRRLDAPQNPWHIIVGSSVLRLHDYVYVFAFAEPSHQIYLLRWPLSALANGNLSSPEWWCGTSRGWTAQRKLKRAPTPVILRGSSEFSVQWNPKLNKFLEIQSWGFGASVIAVRWANRLEGPWSQPTKIYRPPESNRPDAFVYAGKGHPELHGADLIITYVANSMNDGILAKDMSIYYPRFVRVNFRL